MRKTALLLVASIVGLTGLPGCKPHEDNSKVRAAIEARNKDLMATIAQGDAAGVAALYTADARLMPPNVPTQTGRDAIQQAWQGFVDSRIKLELTTREVEGHGDLADEEGTYKVIAPDGTVADVGKYIVIWKKDNGTWFLHRDIWNSDNPAPAPPAPAAAPDASAVPVPDVPEAPEAPAAPPRP